MRDILASSLGYCDENFYIPAFFFANDGLLIANTLRQAEQLLDVMRGVVVKCGLEILNYRGTVINQVLGMKVVDQLKYLGVTVSNKKNCFLQYTKDKILQARKIPIVTYSIIVRSCNKIMIGKTYWKSVFLQGVLYATAILTWNMKERRFTKK